jgi:hypothetical protein
MKRTDRTWILYVVVFILLAALSWGLYRYTASTGATAEGPVVPGPEQTQPPEDAPAQEQEPKIVFEGGEWTKKDADGTLLWRVQAEGEIKYEEDRRRLEATGVALEVYRRGEPAVRIEAPKFIADYEGRRMTFQQGIHGELIGAVGRFSVNEIVYQSTNRKLVGTGGAEFIYGGYSARAETLVIDVKNAKTRLRGDVVLAGRTR